MDAHQPVTLKEGDRYPLGPPSLFQSSTAAVQLTVNQLVGGSIPPSGAKFMHRSSIRLGQRPFKA
jgi:hypothetical protein